MWSARPAITHRPTVPSLIGPFSSTALRDRFQRTLRDHEHRVAQLGPEAGASTGPDGTLDSWDG
jgi:hypothetical protein